MLVYAEVAAILAGVLLIGKELGDNFHGEMGSHGHVARSFGLSLVAGLLLFAVGIVRVGLRAKAYLDKEDRDA